MAGKLYTSYKGFPSFFSGKITTIEDVAEGMLVVAGVPIDQGIVTARPGARYGPRGIREASMLHRGAYEVSAENTLLDVESGIWKKPVASPPLIDVGDFDINPTNTQETTEIVIDGVAEIVKRGGVPVLLGGDHYVAYPGFAGFSKGMSEREGRRGWDICISIVTRTSGTCLVWGASSHMARKHAGLARTHTSPTTTWPGWG